MKKLVFAVGYFLTLHFVALTGSIAAEIQFKLSISGNNLLVSDATGASVASLPLATIGKTVQVPPVSFQVSYGRDARGNYSAVISPNPEQPSTLSFEMVGSRIYLDKNSIVTTTFSTDGKQATVDPGFIGEVKIDGKSVASSTMIGTAAPMAKGDSNSLALQVNPPPAPPSMETTTKKSDMSPADHTNSNGSSASSDSSSVSLASDFKANNPGVKLIPLDPSKEVTEKQMRDMLQANEIAEKEVYWSEPVTPPNPSQAMEITPSEMKVTEVKGEVKITSPQGKTMDAKDGQVVDANSKCVAGENASAAILIGGVDSVRLTPNTTATISSSLDNGVRMTVLDLKEGILFNKIGQRDGEKQDFKVRTPMGVACARGTDFSTTFHEGRLVVLCVQGAVETFDSANQLVGTAAPREARSLSYVKVGSDSAPSGQKSHDVLAVLAAAFQINGKVNAILDSIANGQTPTPQEQAYLKKVAVVDLAIAPVIENAPLLLTRLPYQMPSPSIVAGLTLPPFNFGSFVNPPFKNSGPLPDPANPNFVPPLLQPPLMTPF